MKQSEARFRATGAQRAKSTDPCQLVGVVCAGTPGTAAGMGSETAGEAASGALGAGHVTNLLRGCSDVGDVSRRAQRGG